MRWSWPILVTLLGALLGHLFAPHNFMGKIDPWWVTAFPVFGAIIGFLVGVIAERLNLR